MQKLIHLHELELENKEEGFDGVIMGLKESTKKATYRTQPNIELGSMSVHTSEKNLPISEPNS